MVGGAPIRCAAGRCGRSVVACGLLPGGQAVCRYSRCSGSVIASTSTISGRPMATNKPSVVIAASL